MINFGKVVPAVRRRTDAAAVAAPDSPRLTGTSIAARAKRMYDFARNMLLDNVLAPQTWSRRTTATTAGMATT